MRKIVLGTAAVATLLAAWFAPDQDGGVVGPAAATTREASVAAAPQPEAPATTPASTETAPPSGIDLQIHSRVEDDEPGNVFAKQSWAPRSPLKVMADQAPQQQRAAAPSGPPALPFQFMGRFTDDGKTGHGRFLGVITRIDLLNYLRRRVQ